MTKRVFLIDFKLNFDVKTFFLCCFQSSAALAVVGRNAGAVRFTNAKSINETESVNEETDKD